MPIINGIGCSEFTFEKQEIFDGLINMHTSIVKGIIDQGKVDPSYYYFDMTAGAGLYQDDKRHWIVGSPIRTVKYLHDKGMNYYACLYEISERNAKHLEIFLNPFINNDSITIINADFKEILKCRFEGNQPRYGLVYCDTNATIPPFDLFDKLCLNKAYRYIDILFTYAAASHKRQLKAPGCLVDDRRLPEILSKINKKFWLIREPTGRHQWTFLIGTNWANFPVWNKQNFYGITTSKGKEIYQRICYTKDERGLFDF